MAVPRDLSVPEKPATPPDRTVLRFGDLALEGASRAGEETWFRVRPPGIALDVGRGPLRLVGVSDFFLSHGHLDHSTGLAFLLSQRSFQGLGTSRIFFPAAIAESLAAWLEAAGALEGADLAYRLHPLSAGDRVELAGGFTLEAFATDHVVPSLGCHLWRTRRRLASELAGLAEGEIARRRAAGQVVSESVEELELTYCGDTGSGVFASEPRLFQSRILLLECTFLGSETRARGERFGHLHLEDLLERAASFENEAVILHHLSSRHRPADLRREVASRAPELAAKLHLLAESGEARQPGAGGAG